MFVGKVGADINGTSEDEEKKKNKRRMICVLIGIIIVSLAIAVYVLDKYGTVSLSPGEHYIVNLPFVGASDSPIIEGKAVYTNGSPVKDVNVTVKYKGNNTVLAWNLTNKDGYYKIVLPEIKKSTKYDIYVGYNNATMTLAEHRYTLNLDTDKEIYNRSTDTFVIMTGTINNENAKIENGRMDVNLKYRDESADQWVEVFDYKRYYVNAEPMESYGIPNDEVNISWQIPSDAAIGRYKFYVKTSFNAKESTRTVYFNVTA